MRKLSILAVALFLTACGSGGGLGGIFGGGSGGSGSSYPTDQGSYPANTSIVGTVNFVDSSSQVINVNVNVNNYNNLRTTENSQTIYFDGRTRVLYQNNTYRPTDLERGDQVDIRGYNDGNRFVADTINVTRSVRQ